MKELTILVREFNNCTLPKEEWGHEANIRAALYYAYHSESLTEFTQKFTPRISQYKPEQAHATRTRFWLDQIWKVVQESPNLTLRALELQILASKLNNKKYIYEYYSPEILDTEEAKQQYIEPDKKVTASA